MCCLVWCLSGMHSTWFVMKHPRWGLRLPPQPNHGLSCCGGCRSLTVTAVSSLHVLQTCYNTLTDTIGLDNSHSCCYTHQSPCTVESRQQRVPTAKVLLPESIKLISLFWRRACQPTRTEHTHPGQGASPASPPSRLVKQTPPAHVGCRCCLSHLACSPLQRIAA